MYKELLGPGAGAQSGIDIHSMGVQRSTMCFFGPFRNKKALANARAYSSRHQLKNPVGEVLTYGYFTFFKVILSNMYATYTKP